MANSDLVSKKLILSLGSEIVTSTITGSYWKIVRGPVISTPKVIQLDCQDYQEGDESSMVTTIGEVIPSLRLLTRRFTLESIHEGPFVLSNISLGTPTTLRQSLLSIISWLYRFTAGSIRHKVISGDAKILLAITGDTFQYAQGKIPLDVSSATHIQDMRLNPILELSQPFYSPAENLAISSRTFDLSKTAIGTINGANFNSQVLQAAGDDHTFTFMVGCPAFVA